MVQKWHLCIEVSSFPNPGRAVIKFVFYNMATNNLFHGKREVPGMTTNNEAYYIALVEGLKEEKQHDVNDIEVFTKSELICNQMKGIYRVRKDNLKPLYKEAINWSYQFQHFTINLSADSEKMSTDIMSRAFLSTYVDVKYDIGSPSTAIKIIDHHQYRSPLCEWVVVIIFLGSIIAWFFH